MSKEKEPKLPEGYYSLVAGNQTLLMHKGATYEVACFDGGKLRVDIRVEPKDFPALAAFIQGAR
ncbi:MAG: hypothetical protein CL510_10185 [Actinobacteria bacterium]|jgi:hypothetical protein|nr:hypothetical protein [Actinomycetota bacterium]|tara:strand:+ start:7312 stop:7503 length:192 start_codon:yes stop_codon:yes gene_type:complete